LALLLDSDVPRQFREGGRDAVPVPSLKGSSPCLGAVLRGDSEVRKKAEGGQRERQRERKINNNTNPLNKKRKKGNERRKSELLLDLSISPTYLSSFFFFSFHFLFVSPFILMKQHLLPYSYSCSLIIY
jgi:hypothetical protein